MSRKVYVIFRANKYTDMLCGSFLSKELAQQKLEVLKFIDTSNQSTN